MESLFTKNGYTDITNRLEKLNEQSTANWGKMQVAQMLAHCQKPLELALGKISITKPNIIMAFIFKAFKKTMYNDTPWKKSSPTAKDFLILTEKDFAQEKQKLQLLLEQFTALSAKENWPAHPVFGAFTKTQWGKMQYKHLDHHLKQFGV